MHSNVEDTMTVAPRIVAAGVSLDPEVERLVERGVAELEQRCGRIVRCEVRITVPHRYPTGEPVEHVVGIELTTPVGEVAVTRQGALRLPDAIQDAFHAAERQLVELADVREGARIPLADDVATVRRILTWEGYGFLEAPDGRELYFHRNAVKGSGFDALQPGDAVRFVEAEGERGPQASAVIPLGRRAESTAPSAG